MTGKMNKIAVVIAIRVANLSTPHTPSMKYPCDECGAECWVSYGTEEALLSGQAAHVVCTECMIKEMQDDG